MKTYLLVTNLLLNDKLYESGTHVQMSEDQAAEFVERGTLAEVGEAQTVTPSAPAGDEQNQ